MSYTFYVDFHDGAVRVTIKATCSRLRRWLTGQAECTVLETYMDRRYAIKFGQRLFQLASTLGRRYDIGNPGS